ncbi:MAG: LapA family protein [Pseudanabaena sp. ELA607]
MLRLIGYLLLALWSMGVAIFATQNTDLITIKLFSLTSMRVPLGLCLVLCFGVGTLVAAGLAVIFGRKSPAIAAKGNNADGRYSFSRPITASNRPTNQSNAPKSSNKASSSQTSGFWGNRFPNNKSNSQTPKGSNAAARSVNQSDFDRDDEEEW